MLCRLCARMLYQRLESLRTEQVTQRHVTWVLVPFGKCTLLFFVSLCTSVYISCVRSLGWPCTKTAWSLPLYRTPLLHKAPSAHGWLAPGGLSNEGPSVLQSVGRQNMAANLNCQSLCSWQCYAFITRM